MARIVCLDSTICVWGIKRRASQGQEHKIPQAVRFIESLDEQNTKILIPVPVITELLSAFQNEEEKNMVMQLLSNKNIILKPFDLPSSLKCAELLYKTYNDEEIRSYVREHQVPKSKIKYDAMIVSIAIVNKCDCIYADDTDIERYADKQIPVLEMPNLPIQQKLEFEAK